MNKETNDKMNQHRNQKPFLNNATKSIKERNLTIDQLNALNQIRTENSHKIVMDLSTAIQAVYSNGWKEKGVLPYHKNQLQDQLMMAHFPRIKQVNFASYMIKNLPPFMFERYKTETESGLIYSHIQERDGEEWIYIYECANPVEGLLLRAIEHIMKNTHIRKRINIPKKIHKINDLEIAHYDYVSQQREVVAMHQVILSPEGLDKHTLSQNLEISINRKGIFHLIINDYINSSVFHTLLQQNLICPYAPPLGDITSCLYQVVLQEIFDRKFEVQFRGVNYTRWGNEVIIFQGSGTEEHISSRLLSEFLDSLPIISGQIQSIYSEPSVNQMLDGHSHSGIAFRNKYNTRMFLNEHGEVSVTHFI
jgi:hypothetical protein